MAESIWQGLKPSSIRALFGMTKVMPCYKAPIISFMPSGSEKAGGELIADP
jgi:hypothetical protein